MDTTLHAANATATVSSSPTSASSSTVLIVLFSGTTRLIGCITLETHVDEKEIDGRDYNYLQWRSSDSVESQSIPPNPYEIRKSLYTEVVEAALLGLRVGYTPR